MSDEYVGNFTVKDFAGASGRHYEVKIQFTFHVEYEFDNEEDDEMHKHIQLSYLVNVKAIDLESDKRYDWLRWNHEGFNPNDYINEIKKSIDIDNFD